MDRISCPRCKKTFKLQSEISNSGVPDATTVAKREPLAAADRASRFAS